MGSHLPAPTQTGCHMLHTEDKSWTGAWCNCSSAVRVFVCFGIRTMVLTRGSGTAGLQLQQQLLGWQPRRGAALVPQPLSATSTLLERWSVPGQQVPANMHKS